MRYRTSALVVSLGLCAALTPSLGCEDEPEGEGTEARGAEARAEEEGTRVELCDGETHVTVPEGTPVTHENGEQIAAELMQQWQRRNPDRPWGEDEPARTIVDPADNADLVVEEGVEEETQGPGHTYGRVTERDVAEWDREVRRAVREGDRVFHDAEALGSTIAVSCDMCHPHAANTHPETYPKFQVQLGRVALLRDMINWCLEHPVRAPRMDADDPRMRAMEAYMYAQRRGTELNYGRR